jgi:hypothetical protein
MDEHTHVFNENAKCIGCDLTVQELGIDQPQPEVVEAEVTTDQPAPEAEQPAEEVKEPEPEVQPAPEVAPEPEPAPEPEAQPEPVAETPREKTVDELLIGNLPVVYQQLKHLRDTSEGEKARKYAIAVDHIETACLYFDSARNS